MKRKITAKCLIGLKLIKRTKKMIGSDVNVKSPKIKTESFG
jgi:hypothetical protein